MLFHSLLEVVANSKPTFWLIFWRSFTHNNTHYVFHNRAVTVTGWLWSVKHLQVNLMRILFWLSLYVPTLPWLTTCFKHDQNHHFTWALLNWHYSAPTRFIGESLLTSLFTFFLISIRLNSKKPWPYIRTKFKSWKSWLTWTICAIAAY